MEFAIYAVVLGLVAAIFVPLLYGQASKFLPSSVTANANVPTVIPTGGAGILWSVLTWGIFFGLALWVVSMFGPAGRAVRESV
jgi:hypothetical protein